jgi:hypothetical protein
MNKEIPVNYNGEIVGYTTDERNTIQFNDSDASKKVIAMLNQNQTVWVSSRAIDEIKSNNTVERKSNEEVKNSLSNDDVGKKMLESMIDLLGSYVANGKVDYELLRKVATKIVEYNKVANQEPTSANN